jgi:hypothetical protein
MEGRRLVSSLASSRVSNFDQLMNLVEQGLVIHQALHQASFSVETTGFLSIEDLISFNCIVTL